MSVKVCLVCLLKTNKIAEEWLKKYLFINLGMTISYQESWRHVFIYGIDRLTRFSLVVTVVTAVVISFAVCLS